MILVQVNLFYAVTLVGEIYPNITFLGVTGKQRLSASNKTPEQIIASFTFTRKCQPAVVLANFLLKKLKLDRSGWRVDRSWIFKLS